MNPGCVGLGFSKALAMVRSPRPASPLQAAAVDGSPSLHYTVSATKNMEWNAFLSGFVKVRPVLPVLCQCYKCYASAASATSGSSATSATSAVSVRPVL